MSQGKQSHLDDHHQPVTSPTNTFQWYHSTPSKLFFRLQVIFQSISPRSGWTLKSSSADNPQGPPKLFYFERAIKIVSTWAAFAISGTGTQAESPENSDHICRYLKRENTSQHYHVQNPGVKNSLPYWQKSPFPAVLLLPSQLSLHLKDHWNTSKNFIQNMGQLF